MYAPRHRYFATGLVHGEVQQKQNSTPPKFKVQDVRMRSKK